MDRGFGIEVEGEYGDLTITKSDFDPNWWNQAESIDCSTLTGGTKQKALILN